MQYKQNLEFNLSAAWQCKGFNIVKLKLCFWDCVAFLELHAFSSIYFFHSCEGIEEDYLGHGGGRWTHTPTGEEMF